MERKKVRVCSCLMAILLLAMCYFGVAKAEWDVTPSEEDYIVTLKDTNGVFICNKKTIGSKVGTEYYLTYTVESVQAEKYTQQGVIGTNVPAQRFPYVSYEKGKGGSYKYDWTNKLLVAEKTYFLKFTITEDGYDYRVAWGQEKDSAYVEFMELEESVNQNLGHFGIFLADVGVNARLVKVRAYDKDGNDLGVMATPCEGEATVGREKPYPKDTEVEHTYNISVSDVNKLAVSNHWAPTSNKVYLEYTVKSVNDAHIYQPGVILSDAPEDPYPYLEGFLVYDQYPTDVKTLDEGPLLTVGADYLIIFEKHQDKLDVMVQRNYKGESVYIEFELTYGEFNPEHEFYSLWLGGVDKPLFDLELVDVKCYDSNRNNLGVQCNQPTAVITHFGELEDYTECQALYYNEEQASYYALYEDKSLKVTKDGVTKEGTYRIEDEVMTAKVGKQSEDFDYLYRFFKDKEENKYMRVHTCKLIFDTGDGSEVKTQIISADNGYKPLQVSDPVWEGKKFEGWYTADGKEFDFNGMITESTTVYAKWGDVAYASRTVTKDYLPNIAVGAGTVFLLVAIVAGVVIIVRGKKNGSIH